MTDVAEAPKPVRAVRQLCEWLDLPEAGVAEPQENRPSTTRPFFGGSTTGW